MCFRKKVRYVETYDGWIIAKFKEAFLQQPSGNKVTLYVAVHPNRQYTLTGVDLPDLRADIDEVKRGE